MIFCSTPCQAQCDCTDTVTTGIPQAECEALVAIDNSTTFLGDNWNTNTDCGTWTGVSVSGGHVTAIDLVGMNLIIGIPPELGDLTNLERFYIEASGLAELIAEDLRQVQQCLNEITGEFSSEDLLGAIFSRFCIGK